VEQSVLRQSETCGIEHIVAEYDAESGRKENIDKEHQWDVLLTPLNVRGFERWTDLNIALKQFCLGASGPRNPKTGQYVVEIRMVEGQAIHQVKQAIVGIETLRPFLKPYRGVYEFYIACREVNVRDKNWLKLEINGKAKIINSTRPEIVFDGLQDALSFIAENRTSSGVTDSRPSGSGRRRNGW
jgi:hypothetical protein